MTIFIDPSLVREVLEEKRAKNIIGLLHTPYPDEYSDRAQRGRWIRMLTLYSHSRLAYFGTDKEFTEVWNAWSAIDNMSTTAMPRKFKSAMYFSLFENVFPPK
ncbi:MAG: hypothetical protein ACI9YE_003887 [Psychroserpens sp.]|jgi:hypothetical protein